MGDRGVMSKVRFSEMETSFLSSDKPVEGRWILLLLAEERLGLSMPLGRCVL